jgi:hypothetical protein
VVRYGLEELAWSAGQVTPDGIGPAAVDETYAADGLIPEDVRAELLAGVAHLESNPFKDWHPGSDEQVGGSGGGGGAEGMGTDLLSV